MALDIITKVPESFLAEFEDEFQKSVPAEKVRATLNQAFIGRALVAEGACAVEGLGQKLGEVDARTYFRWLQQKNYSWGEKSAIHEFFADNAHLRSKGWTPKASPLRHGMTFVGGAPVR